MTAELPWTRNLFSGVLADKSESIPSQYSVFYDNMSLSSTYVLPLVLLALLVLGMYLYRKQH